MLYLCGKITVYPYLVLSFLKTVPNKQQNIFSKMYGGFFASTKPGVIGGKNERKYFETTIERGNEKVAEF